MTIGFYSYKGGTGRTTTMANVAVMLAHTGRRVACLDLDVTAPSLDIAMNIGTMPRKTIRDFFMAFNVPLEEMYVDWSKATRHPVRGSLYVFPMPRVGTDELIAEVPPGIINNLERLLADIENELDVDYALLDVRSGFTDESAKVFTVSEKIFVSSRFTFQHVVGLDCLVKLLDAIRDVKRRKNKSFEYYVIFNDIPKDLPPNEETKVAVLRDHHRAILIRENRMMRWMDRVVVAGYQTVDSDYSGEIKELEDGYREIIRRIEE